eukprot:GHUV01009185.1.p1 GENE.GHUV01009185.1~~GHUV01009185.1.p1  ORF type:complete len:511 (+),score=160.84 GHUV01009185.1:201-1733(+)
MLTKVAKDNTGGVEVYRVRRPNNQWLRLELTRRECLERYRKLNNIERAQQLWEFWYKHFEKGCIHGYQCSRRCEGHECNVGGRKHELKMIGGAVLPIWKVLHEITMKSIHGRNAEGKKIAKATVQRGKLEDGTPVIGMTMVDQDFRLVIDKIGEIEEMGGVEALARMAYGSLWGDMDGVWAPEDDDEDARIGVWTGSLNALDLLRTVGPDADADGEGEGDGSSSDGSDNGSDLKSFIDDDSSSASDSGSGSLAVGSKEAIRGKNRKGQSAGGSKGTGGSKQQVGKAAGAGGRGRPPRAAAAVKKEVAAEAPSNRRGRGWPRKVKQDSRPADSPTGLDSADGQDQPAAAAAKHAGSRGNSAGTGSRGRGRAAKQRQRSSSAADDDAVEVAEPDAVLDTVRPTRSSRPSSAAAAAGRRAVKQQQQPMQPDSDSDQDDESESSDDDSSDADSALSDESSEGDDGSSGEDAGLVGEQVVVQQQRMPGAAAAAGGAAASGEADGPISLLSDSDDE